MKNEILIRHTRKYIRLGFSFIYFIICLSIVKMISKGFMITRKTILTNKCMEFKHKIIPIAWIHLPYLPRSLSLSLSLSLCFPLCLSLYIYSPHQTSILLDSLCGIQCLHRINFYKVLLVDQHKFHSLEVSRKMLLMSFS